MPGKLVQTGATGICSHGGTIVYKGTTPRVTLSATPAVAAADIQTVIACPLNVSGKPQPCVTGSEYVPAARVFIDGKPALLDTGIGLGKSAEQAPQGPVKVNVAQPRVMGM